MVQKIFRFLNRESSSLHQAAYLLGLFAILSQLLAFLRDRLLAHLFGASTTLDIYYAAFRIPDFLFVTIASVVSISVLVPFIIERNSAGKVAVKEFIDSVFAFFSILIIIVSVLAFFLIPHIAPMLFRGFSAEVLEEVIFVTRLLLLSPIFLGFSNLFGSITQAYNRFAIYALAPLLYNAGIIFGIIAFGVEFGAAGVALGVVLGAFLHGACQVPFVLKAGLFPRLRMPNWQLVRGVAMLSIPRTLTLSTTQLAIIFLTALASLMVSGSVSIFSFAFNLQSVPLSIIGVSYSLAAFPTLTRHFAEKNMDAFLSQLTSTARAIIFWSLPLSGLFVILRAQIVRVLLGTGRFDWNDTRLTAAAVAIFVLSSVFQSLVLLFMRAYYSVGKTRKPFIISAISMFVMIAASYAFVNLFYQWDAFRFFIASLLKVEDLPGTIVLALPLGFSLGTAIGCLLLWFDIEREFKGFTRSVVRTLFQSFSAAVIMATVTYFGLALVEPMFNTSLLTGLFLQGLAAGLLGILAGVIVLYLLKSEEQKQVWKTLQTRFWKADIIATDPEIV